jgi:hypothetical protein
MTYGVLFSITMRLRVMRLAQRIGDTLEDAYAKKRFNGATTRDRFFIAVLSPFVNARRTSNAYTAVRDVTAAHAMVPTPQRLRRE